MVEKVYPMTLEGKEKLEQELEELKTIKRKEIVERIKIARSFGDLSENSEYESAKEEYTIVGSAEADPFSGKISNDSPIAQALIGKQLGDQVIIATPGGDMTVKITKVEAN